MTRIPRLAALMLVAWASLAAAEGEGVPWLKDFAEAKKAAADSGKLIFADIYAEWCPPCKMMDQHTFTEESVKTLLAGYVPLKLDADKHGELVMNYSEGSLPTLALIQADGTLVDYTSGFLSGDDLAAWVKSTEAGREELKALEAQWKAEPASSDIALQLAERYHGARRYEDAVAVLTALPKESLNALGEVERGDVLWRTALSHFGGENFDGGVGALEQLIASQPDHPRTATAQQLLGEGRYLAATRALENGDYVAARAGFEKVQGLVDTAPELAMMAGHQLALVSLMGQPRPEIEASEWLRGETRTLESLQGKVVLLEFFQVVCPGCEKARPEIERMRAENADKGLEVLGIAVAFEEASAQPAEAIGEYVEMMDFQYPVAIDKDKVTTFEKYAAQGAPWVALIGRDGTVQFSGFFDAARVEERVKTLLSEG